MQHWKNERDRLARAYAWTIMRLTMLNNDPKSGKVKAGNVGKGEVGTQISRADLAEFLFKQVSGYEVSTRQAPAISN